MDTAEWMTLLAALLPGAATALFGFMPLAYVSGIWGSKFPLRPILAAIAYSILLFVLWVGIAVAGFAATYKLWPAFRGHGAAFAFFAPYVILSLPGCGFLILWFVARVNKSRQSMLEPHKNPR